MPMMISDLPIHVAHNGADAVFQPNVEVFVRQSLVAVALDMGARVTGESAVQTSPDSDETPDYQIQAAIQHLMDEGKTSAFGADGKPKVRAIEKVLGENISADDRDRIWDAMDG